MANDPQILWRRLDLPGHDACRIWRDGEVQTLGGVAVWRDPAGPAHMTYLVACNPDWVTRSVRVQGRIGARDLTLSVHRADTGEWRVNGESLPDLHGLQDIDLGFTPATNTLPIRRMRAARQDAAEIAAVWLDPADWTLKRLPQTYRRTDAGWHYTSPGFATDLTVDADGLVTDYPDLWIKED